MEEVVVGERPKYPPLPPGMKESAGELVLPGRARVPSQILWHAHSLWRPYVLTASYRGADGQGGTQLLSFTTHSFI